MAVTIELFRLTDPIGRIWTEADGTVHYDEGIAPIVEHFATPPHVEGVYKIDRSGRSLRLADGEAFVRALPWAFDLSNGSVRAGVV